MILATGAGFAAFLLGVGTLVAKSQRRPVAAGREAMIGAVAVVRRRLAPRGKVAVMGELWDAVAGDGATVEEGAEVSVLAVEGMRLVVRPLGRS